MTVIPIVSRPLTQTWMDLWETTEYHNSKKLQWNAVNEYIGQPVGTSCEIGCGEGYDSLWFQQAYNTNVYLIEGISEQNSNDQLRDTKFGTADNFAYYHNKDALDAKWDQLGLQRAHLTPENCSELSNDIVFDLIFSFKSCGAHYPMTTYTDFIRKHSNENTRLLFDLRNGMDDINSINIDYEIVDVLVTSNKHKTVELKLI